MSLLQIEKVIFWNTVGLRYLRFWFRLVRKQRKNANNEGKAKILSLI